MPEWRQTERDAFSTVPPDLARELLAELEDHEACLYESGARMPDEAGAWTAPALLDVVRQAYPLEQCRVELSRLTLPGLVAMLALLLVLAALGSLNKGLTAEAAWLVQGLCAGVLAAAVAWAVRHSWAEGPGRLLATLLQLSPAALLLPLLMVLVVPKARAAVLISAGWPQWTDCRYLLALSFVLATAVLLVFRHRALPLAIGVLVTGLALYPGGPLQGSRYEWHVPATESAVLDLASAQPAASQRIGGPLVASSQLPDAVPLHLGISNHLPIGQALLSMDAVDDRHRGELVPTERVMFAPQPWPGLPHTLFLVLSFGLLIGSAALVLPQLRRRPVDDMAVALGLLALLTAIMPFVLLLIGSVQPDHAADPAGLNSLLDVSGGLGNWCFLASYGLLLGVVTLRRGRTTAPPLLAAADPVSLRSGM